MIKNWRLYGYKHFVTGIYYGKILQMKRDELSRMNYAYNSVLCRLYKISFNSLDVTYAFSYLCSIKSEIESRTRTFLNRCERIDNAIVRHMFLVSGA